MNLATHPKNISYELTDKGIEQLAEIIAQKILSGIKQGPSKSEDEILWIDDAVKFLNLAKPTIYGMTSKGTIQFYRRGRKIYFLKSDLEAWLMAGKQKTLSEMERDVEKYLSNNFNSENR